MTLHYLKASCSFVERESAVKTCLRIAKEHEVKVLMTVNKYANSTNTSTEVEINKRSSVNKVLSYIEKML